MRGRDGLVVYTRNDCGLCVELLGELLEYCAGRGLTFEVRDVDADPGTQRRYGLQVPVLTLDGETVCFGRLDVTELTRRLSF
jgi:predicted thioredoxin/glutaredoxin